MNKPQITRPRIEALLTQHGVDLAKNKVALVGIRGYFRNSMGKPGQNDIGIFDDGFAWIDETAFATFNGNTDPSRHYQHIATLRAGIWRYMTGIHDGPSLPPYKAFRQAAPVTVMRWDEKKATASIADTGMFGINIHHGGAGTSSIGCQTVPMDQWGAFRELGYMLVKRAAIHDFPYLLVENDGSIA